MIKFFLNCLLIGDNFPCDTEDREDGMIISFNSVDEFDEWYLTNVESQSFHMDIRYVVFRSVADMLNFKRFKNMSVEWFILFEVHITEEIPRLSRYDQVLISFDKCTTSITLHLSEIQNQIYVRGGMEGLVRQNFWILFSVWPNVYNYPIWLKNRYARVPYNIVGLRRHTGDRFVKLYEKYSTLDPKNKCKYKSNAKYSFFYGFLKENLKFNFDTSSKRYKLYMCLLKQFKEHQKIRPIRI